MNWKPIEPTLHRLMGFWAMIFNLRLLLERRERNQLPPANDRYPVFLIEMLPPSSHGIRWRGTPVDESCAEIPGCDTYWSRARVLDTLDDSRDYDRGGTIAWPILVGASVAAGWFLRGWAG